MMKLWRFIEDGKGCQLGGIPIVDIYHSGQVNTNVDTMRKTWSYNNAGETSDGNGTHLTGEGYKKWYQPHIVAKMLNCLVN